ncbi:transcriptional regulator [Synechococcus sp. PCC 7336]|uniref:transcriptional regulator n=1 Tax=Synechococcus sp. PCC 7336 TaxID=195250 RepID=UPI00034BEECE|nr:transcriptional regulator [Synechococcus sp. PCC 7336]
MPLTGRRLIDAFARDVQSAIAQAESQEALAKELGTSSNTLKNYKKGNLKNLPDPIMLREIASKVGFTSLDGYLAHLEGRDLDANQREAAPKPTTIIGRQILNLQDLEEVHSVIELANQRARELLDRENPRPSELVGEPEGEAE